MSTLLIIQMRKTFKGEWTEMTQSLNISHLWLSESTEAEPKESSPLQLEYSATMGQTVLLPDILLLTYSHETACISAVF